MKRDVLDSNASSPGGVFDRELMILSIQEGPVMSLHSTWQLLTALRDTISRIAIRFRNGSVDMQQMGLRRNCPTLQWCHCHLSVISTRTAICWALRWRFPGEPILGNAAGH